MWKRSGPSLSSYMGTKVRMRTINVPFWSLVPAKQLAVYTVYGYEAWKGLQDLWLTVAVDKT